VINFSFVEPAWEADFAGEANPIRLLNPIASQLSVMRSSLIGSLLANLRHNQARKLARIRVFEIGRVYLRDAAAGDGPLAVAGLRQPVRVAAAAYGPAFDEQWGAPSRAVDLFDLKSDLEALAAPCAARFEAALILQPLVENAIKHGMARNGQLHLMLTAKIDNGHLVMQVQDNGIGMIFDDMPGIPDQNGKGLGIGLTNVRERLRSLYGSTSLLNIQSTIGEGTEVTLKIPITGGKQ